MGDVEGRAIGRCFIASPPWKGLAVQPNHDRFAALIHEGLIQWGQPIPGLVEHGAQLPHVTFRLGLFYDGCEEARIDCDQAAQFPAFGLDCRGMSDSVGIQSSQVCLNALQLRREHQCFPAERLNAEIGHPEGCISREGGAVSHMHGPKLAPDLVVGA